jgi:hypothetical protein
VIRPSCDTIRPSCDTVRLVQPGTVLGVDDTIWRKDHEAAMVIRTDFAHEFLVDTQTLTHPDRPILVVNRYDYVEGLEDQGKGPQYGATFRVVPSAMWCVQNNLSLANMDWEELAESVDDDGLFRVCGFE